MSSGARPVVAITRDEGADDRLSRALASRGLEPLPLQTIAIRPPEDVSALLDALRAWSTMDWVVFTSPHAVDAVFRDHPDVVPAPAARPSIAAVGPSTASRLERYGRQPDVVPVRGGAADLLEALRSMGAVLAGARVLWPCSDIARPQLADALRAAGAEVRQPAAYRTELVCPPEIDRVRQMIDRRELAAVAFLSPSSARGLAAALPEARLSPLSGRTLVASIGPTTSDALRELGAPPDIESDRRDVADLAAALARRLCSVEHV